MNDSVFADSQSYRKHIVALLSQLDHKMQAEWAADCAEHVLVNFESRYSDDRPHKAIEACRGWIQGNVTVAEARKAAFASHAAARETENNSACAAARSAAHAAAAAHVSGHAFHAANYAVKSVMFDKNDVTTERKWQFVRLIITLMTTEENFSNYLTDR